MKKSLLVILTVVLIACSCVFSIGCNAFKKDNEDQIVVIYNAYVEYAEKHGQTPLSFEEWISSPKGDKGDDGEKGEKGDKGDKGDKGQDGVTPTIEISNDGYWVINGVKTEHKAIGKDGTNGINGATPTIKISSDGYWVINGVKTEDKATIGNLGNVVDGTEGLAYILNDDISSYSVRGLGMASDLDIVIPSTYNGLPVTKILIEAFKNQKIRSIKIPNGVESIGDSAFYGCESLTSVEIPKSVYHIGDSAFLGCASLVSIEINCSYYIRYYTFSGCRSLTSIEIPNDVYMICGDAFNYCTSLVSIKIPKSVTVIEDAFYRCDSLTSVFYEGTVEDWGNISIDDNDCLTNATIYYFIENEEDLPNDNENYWHYVDGVPTIWNVSNQG